MIQPEPAKHFQLHNGNGARLNSCRESLYPIPLLKLL